MNEYSKSDNLKTTKKHHYVSQFYLRYFSYQIHLEPAQRTNIYTVRKKDMLSGELNVFDNRIKSICYGRNYNTYTHRTDDSDIFFEKELARLEADISSEYKNITIDEQLSDNASALLKLFVSILYCNSPNMRELLKDTHNQLATLCKNLSETTNAKTLLFGDEHYAIEQFTSMGDKQLRNISLGGLPEIIYKVFNIICNKTMITLDYVQPIIFTCDNPVIATPEKNYKIAHRGIPLIHTDFIFPVSPNRVVIFTSRPDDYSNAINTESILQLIFENSNSNIFIQSKELFSINATEDGG